MGVYAGRIVGARISTGSVGIGTDRVRLAEVGAVGG